MPLVHLCVAGVQPPQFLALPDDGTVHELTYVFDGQEHHLKLQAGNHLVAPASSSSPSSSSSASSPSSSSSSSLNPSLPPKSTKRKRSYSKGEEGKQQQQQVCVTVWYEAQKRQGDATAAPRDGEAKQPLLGGVVCNTTQPQRLEALPGSPVVWVCAGEAGVEEVAMMARAVRSEFSWVDVPEGIEDDIGGDFHAEIKLPNGRRYVTCHDGRAYVTHDTTGADGVTGATVSVFDVADRKLLQTWSMDGGWGTGVVVHDQSVYVANGVLDCIQVYGLDDGTFQRQFGTLGTGPGQFKHPCGLALGDGEPEPLLYVCDSLNNRVQVFELNGDYVRSFGSEGGGPGELKCPAGLVVDEECVYVCDSDNHRVQVFGLDGTPKRRWGSEGGGEGECIWPIDVVVQGELLYVSDQGNHRVQVFDKKTGTFVRSWGSEGNGQGQFNDPLGMALTDDGGQLWVCDSFRVQIFRFVPGVQFLKFGFHV